MKTAMAIVLFGMIICALVWVGTGPNVTPEMEECMRSHGSQGQHAAVLRKYCGPEIMNQAMGLLAIKNPQVVRTQKTGKAVCYLVEGSIGEASTETPGETMQSYCVCWESGRVVSLDLSGGRLRAYGG